MIGDFTVEDQGGRLERGNRGDQRREPAGVVTAWPADELHPITVLVGHHAPAVVFFLIDPSVMVNGTRDQRRLNQVDRWKAQRSSVRGHARRFGGGWLAGHQLLSHSV